MRAGPPAGGFAGSEAVGIGGIVIGSIGSIGGVGAR